MRVQRIGTVSEDGIATSAEIANLSYMARKLYYDLRTAARNAPPGACILLAPTLSMALMQSSGNFDIDEGVLANLDIAETMLLDFVFLDADWKDADRNDLRQFMPAEWEKTNA